MFPHISSLLIAVSCNKALPHWSVSPVGSSSDHHHICVCSEASGYWWLCWRGPVLKRNRMMWESPWRLLFHCDSKDNHTLCNWTDLLTVCSCWPSHINSLPLCPPGMGNGSVCAFYWYYADRIWNRKGLISSRDSCTKVPHHITMVNFWAGHF